MIAKVLSFFTRTFLVLRVKSSLLVSIVEVLRRIYNLVTLGRRFQDDVK